jgi:hypothetical protein
MLQQGGIHVRDRAFEGTAESIEGARSSAARFGRVAALLACFVALLGIGASAATAAPAAQPAWGYLASFGTGGEQNGTFQSVPRSPLAVDSHGNVFIANGNGYINFGQPGVVAFAPDPIFGGTPLTGVSTGAQFPVDIAIDPTDDALYVQDYVINQEIKRYVSDGAPVPTYTEDPTFSLPTGGQNSALAVDPLSGDLLVSDTFGGQIRRYSPNGTLIETIPVSFGAFRFAVAPDGTFYLGLEANEPKAPAIVVHLSASGKLLTKLEVGLGTVTGLAVDPTTGAVIAAAGGRLALYSAAGVFESETIAHGQTSSLAFAHQGDRLYEWTGGNNFGGELNAYIPAVFPGIESPVVSNITTNSLHVSVDVDPGAGPPAGSELRFEYSVDGGKNWTETPVQPVSGQESVGSDINGLEPNRTYRIRAVAFNSLASHTSTPIVVTTLGVAPIVQVQAASEVTETGAVLNGAINTIGLQTTYHFEYGTTTAYGSRVPVLADAIAGNAYTLNSFSRTIAGLSPGASYHFRLVATNLVGTTYGADQTFSTLGAGSVIRRAYEQVTPPEKNGNIIASSIGFQAAAQGGAIAYTTKAGVKGSPLTARWISVRGQSDWNGEIATDPPMTPLGTSTTVIQTTKAISSDFSHAFIVSNQALAPGAVEGNANLYQENVATGALQFIGGTGHPDAFGSFSQFATSNIFQGGSPDFSTILFFSRYPLLPNAPLLAFYRWTESQGLEVASVLPDGDVSGVVHQESSQRFDAMSADGKRFYFTGVNGSEVGVFLRDGSGPSKAISVSRVPGDPSVSQPATLLGTNSSGRYAFFVSKAKLTNDAPGKPLDLYRYDALEGSLEYLGTQAYTTVQSGPDGPVIQYGSLGIGENGETIYFDGLNELEQLGGLTVWHNGAVRSISNETVGSSEGRLSSNGRYFAFYGSIEGTSVVKRYDVETDQVSCASCKSGGAPITAVLPPGGAGDTSVSGHYQTAVDDSGTVYFTTAGRLTPADTNGSQDVYTWRDGTLTLISPGNEPFDAYYADSSADGSDVFFTTAQQLVGRDTDASVDIYDARMNGGLSIQSPQPPEECLGDSCRSAPGPMPQAPSLGSETQSGSGNIKSRRDKHKKNACAKGKRKAKVHGVTKCVKNSKPSKNKPSKNKPSKNKKGDNR